LNPGQATMLRFSTVAYHRSERFLFLAINLSEVVTNGYPVAKL
jgi:hypothetical protein